MLKALVLAAGEGSRLYPFTRTFPKPLFPIGGTPLIDYALDTVARSGITEVGVNVFTGSEYLEVHIRRKEKQLGLRCEIFRERELLGTGGPLRNLGGLWDDGDLLVLTADIITSLDVRKFHESHRRSGAPISVAAFEHDWPLEEWGGDVAVVDDGGKTIQFQISPGRQAASRLACSGAYLISQEAKELLPDRTKFELNSDLCVQASVLGKLNTYPGEFDFFDFGTPERVHYGSMLLLEGELGSHATALAAEASQDVADLVTAGVVVDGAVHVSKGARVDAGTTLRGPVVIGQDVSVGPGCTIERAVITPGTVLAAGTVLSSGIFGDVQAYDTWGSGQWTVS